MGRKKSERKKNLCFTVHYSRATSGIGDRLNSANRKFLMFDGGKKPPSDGKVNDGAGSKALLSVLLVLRSCYVTCFAEGSWTKEDSRTILCYRRSGEVARSKVAEKVAVTNPPQVIEVVPRQGFTLEHLTLLRLDSPAACSTLTIARFVFSLLCHPRPVSRAHSPLCLFLYCSSTTYIVEHLGGFLHVETLLQATR